MSAREPDQRQTRGRRGATLILVALLIVVLVGMVGVVIDFSRFYAYRIQMETTADAAALAAVQEIARSSPATAPDTALHYVPLNVVDGGSAFVPRDSVQPGIWSFSAKTFSPAANFTDPGVNAAKVSVNHTASYTLGRVWRTTDQNLTTTATAALGYVSTTTCLKPWAVSYQSLLDQIFLPAGSKGVGYDLTEGDINSLSLLGPADEIQLVVTDTLAANGIMAAVQVSAPWGFGSYRQAISGPCANKQVGPGTSLTTYANTGRVQSQTQNALNTYCTNNGGVTGGPTDFSCTADPKVAVAVWDSFTGSGTGAQYHVKYVAAFAITRFKNIPAGHLRIYGYFTSMPGLGTVGSTPTPILEGLLVQ